MTIKDIKFKKLFMDSAILTSNMSFSKRRHVGCVIVKDNRIICNSWNGTPTGFDNNCEDKEGNTLNIVIHAEANAIAFCAKEGLSLKDSVLYVTLSPCFECAKLIIQSGIKKVIYFEEYRILESINFLKQAGIEVEKYE